MLNAIRFLSLFCTGLLLGPALAHLFSLPHKIDMPRETYFEVQQIYRGWALIGIAVAGAIVFTGWWLTVERNHPKVRNRLLLALICMAAAQVVFWLLTFPANQQTVNWTRIPENWERLRRSWEYSHAAGALLILIAFAALILAALARLPSDSATGPLDRS